MISRRSVIGFPGWLATTVILTMTACSAPAPSPSALKRAITPDKDRMLDLRLQGTPLGGSSPAIPGGVVVRHVGEIPEGRVWRPLNWLSTINLNNNQHEAWLVVNGADRWVGYYLPGVQGYTRLVEAIRIEMPEYLPCLDETYSSQPSCSSLPVAPRNTPSPRARTRSPRPR